MKNATFKFLRSYVRDADGNFGMIAGILMVPLTIMAGGALDFGLVYYSKLNLERAADSAAIAAVSDGKSAAESQSNAQVQAIMQTTVDQIFMGGISPRIDRNNIRYTVESTVDAGVVKARVDFKYNYKPAFLSIIGMNEINAGGKAEAKGSIGSYSEFQILVDVSSSMGIGASQEDIDFLNANNRHGGSTCAFACHSTIDYVHATWPQVKLRIDVAKSAMQLAFDTVQAEKHPDSHIKFGLHRFGNTYQTVFSPDNPQSEDYGWMKEQVENNITLTPENGSRIAHFTREFSNEFTTSGTGETPSDPKKFALVVTDGSQWLRSGNAEFDRNIEGEEWGQQRAQLLDPTACDALKAKGVTVYFLYTTYIDAPNNTFTDRLVDAIANRLSPKNIEFMKQCASEPSNFFEAKDAAALTAAMKQIFHEVAVPTHISG